MTHPVQTFCNQLNVMLAREIQDAAAEERRLKRARTGRRNPASRSFRQTRIYDGTCEEHGELLNDDGSCDLCFQQGFLRT